MFVLFVKARQLELFGSPTPGRVREHTRTRRGKVTRVVEHASGKLHAKFGAAGAPKPGERGHRPAPELHAKAFGGVPPGEVAERMFDAGARLYEDPDFAIAYAEARDGFEGAEWSRSDLADLLHVPTRGRDGEELTDGERWNAVEGVVALVAETRPQSWSGEAFGRDISEGQSARLRRAGRRPEPSEEYESERVGRVGALPAWAAVAILEDGLTPGERGRLVSVTIDEAKAFVRRHHSALPEVNTRGCMYAIGVKRGGRLVAVATAGTPTGRWADPHRVLELTRVASDGTTRGASSMLVSRLLDLLPESTREGAAGPALFVTYSLTSEEGSTYRSLRDKGLRPVAIVGGKTPGGARRAEGGLKGARKVRWEAGPGAAPARWDLLGAAA